MKRKLLVCFILTISSCFALNVNSDVLLQVNTPIGLLIAYRPDAEELNRTAPIAKAIFLEAFATTYREYHQKSGSQDSVEKWLRLKQGLTLEGWLSNVFDDEYEESLAGLKQFVYLADSDGNLVGWLTHSPVSANGDLYLSQCSLEAGSRNQRVATNTFAQAFDIKKIFPGVKEIKLITRKINLAAQHLYTKAGFIRDETIDPGVYGESYDDRYVGYRLPIKE